jgi:hypothetical protein
MKGNRRSRPATNAMKITRRAASRGAPNRRTVNANTST